MSPTVVDRVVRSCPAVLLGALAVSSQVRTGVAWLDVLLYALTWLVTILFPGLVLSRVLLGTRATLVEDLSLAAAAGLAGEALTWLIGAYGGLGAVVRWWWVPVLAAGAAIPEWRRRALAGPVERLPLAMSASLAAVVAAVLVRVHATGFLTAPIPPRPTSMFLDHWWQLSLVQEMMRYERPQVPQAVGEDLAYHFFAHIHIASASRWSGVAPEVVYLRLWLVPVVLTMVGLAFAVGRVLTRSGWAGVASAAIAFAFYAIDYIWLDVSSLSPWPIYYHSPTATLANVGLLAVVFGVVTMFERGVRAPLVAWTVLVLGGAAGQKSTVVPLLLAGTVAALGRALWRRSNAVRPLTLGAIGLAVVQLLVSLVAAGTSGGKVVILGTLETMPAFTDLVATTGLRGTNEGLVADSISTPSAWAYAVLATVALIGLHAPRLAGLVGLADRDLRRRLADWFLAGAVAAGYAISFVVDHVGLSQAFFVAAGSVLGALLTVRVLWPQAARIDTPVRVATIGLAIGIATALVIVVVAELRAPIGPLERLVVPAIAAAAVAVGLAAWRWYGRLPGTVVWVLAVSAVIGLAIPRAVEDAVVQAGDVWSNEFVEPDPALVVRAGEQEAMLWLRASSDPDDVIATNLHCIPYRTAPTCNARGFWVVGLSGRRAVLEGWAYIDETQALQGVDDLPFSRQPAPFPERFRLNEAVFTDGDQAALAELVRLHDVRWLVAVHRAGPTPAFPTSTATVVYDNGEVTIFEVSSV